MTQYHIKKDGSVGLCNATQGNCPLNNFPHYSDINNAQLCVDVFYESIEKIKKQDYGEEGCIRINIVNKEFIDTIKEFDVDKDIFKDSSNAILYTRDGLMNYAETFDEYDKEELALETFTNEGIEGLEYCFPEFSEEVNTLFKEELEIGKWNDDFEPRNGHRFKTKSYDLDEYEELYKNIIKNSDMSTMTTESIFDYLTEEYSNYEIAGQTIYIDS